VERCSAVLRLAEQLERPRDQTVEGIAVDVRDGTVSLSLRHTADVTVARWAAERQRDLFKKALGRELVIVD
jgi:exopolyphosphatase/guanosine-5'-triphosphate,3'-diphosphate pyrophosphatase